jgi:hypothetical protein
VSDIKYLPDSIMQQELVRAIMQIEVEEFRVKLAQTAASDPDVQTGNGETAAGALVRLAEGKARLEDEYKHLLEGQETDEQEA